MGDDRHAALSAFAVAPAARALLAGALAGLALPPVGLPLLLWPPLALLWSLAGDPPDAQELVDAAAAAAQARARRWGQRWGGLLWGLAAVLVSHRWLLWLHPLDWIGVPLPLSLPICLLLWLGCGALGGALVQLWLLLVRRLGAEQAATALLASSLWGLAEVLLAAGPLFWIGLGGSALPADRALAGLASLGGAGLVAAVQLLIGWSLWRALRRGGAWRRWLSLVLLLLIGSHGLGLAALAGRESPAGEGLGAFAGALSARSPAPSAPPPPSLAPPGATRAALPAEERLLLVQPAIPTRLKFEAASQRRLLAQLLAAQRRAAVLLAADQGEPASLSSPSPTISPSLSALLLPEGALSLDQPLPEAPPLEVLSGGFRREGVELRSSLLRFPLGSREPRGWIDKHRLVPLGEWVPLANLWRWSGLSAVGGLEPGPASRLLDRPAGPIGVAICYELADGRALARASHQGARWLLASANLDPYPPLLQEQFLALGQLRAIETGRWLVAVANTGPSVVVDAAGRVRERLPAGQPAEAVLSLQPRIALTPYDRWGEGPLLTLLLLGASWRLAGWRLAGFRSRRPPGRRH